jgi:hypothetical protein
VALLAVLSATLLVVALIALTMGDDSRRMPAPAAAVPAIDQAGADAMADRASALVTSAAPRGWTVAFRPWADGSPRANADRDAQRITVFVRGDDVAHRVAHDLAHEIGHAWDHAVLSDADRRAYLDRRDRSDAQWWPGGAWSDYSSGAGDLAEVYARCHAASPDFRSRLAPVPANACDVLPMELRS